MAATKAISSKPAKPAKQRGKPFQVGEDARRHKDGTKSSAAVAFNKQIRQIIVEVGDETVNANGQMISRIEGAVRGMYQQAAKGNVPAFNALVERVEGKALQIVDLTSSDGSMKPAAVTFIPYVSNDSDNS